MPALFIASIAENDYAHIALWIVGGLIVLGPALESWMKVVERMRGKGLDETRYVTLEAFETQKLERDRQMREFRDIMQGNFQRLESTLKTVAEELPTIHRALGRLEGHDEAGGSVQPRKHRR